MRYGSLCSGIGGLDLAVEEVFGAEVAWHAEVDREACRVLAKHWPGVPNYGDITEVGWEGALPVDLVCAGPPCQPVSQAGQRKGHHDERFLWDAVLEVVGVVRPTWLVLENPSGIRPWLPALFYRLAQMGFVGCYGSVSAAEVGACHLRERYFLLAAHPGRQRLGQQRFGAPAAEERGRWGQPHLDHQPGHSDDPVLVADPDGGLLDFGAGRLDGTQAPGQPGACLDGDGPAGGGPVVARMPDGSLRDYGPALRRHGLVLGRPWPSPVAGAGLNPAFLEWMMMFPENWTEAATPAGQRRLLGNAVCPPQALYALRGLLARLEPQLVS